MNALSQPLSLPCGAVLPNRIVKSAMSERLAATDRAPTAALSVLYERWARGGTGLLITGNVMVDPAHIGEPGNVVVEDERHVVALRAWAKSAHSQGSQIWMQINHPGRQAPRTLVPEPVAPSDVGLKNMGGMFAQPRALTDAEVTELVQRFATTASVAQKAGFDGVQIHAAHGYLISQFLSPLANLRTDDWGGNAEKRRRFLLEIVAAMRAAVGPKFAIGVKLNSADFQRGGFTEEESMDVVRALEAAGIDLLEISGGTYERPKMFEESLAGESASTQSREAFFLDYAKKVRQVSALPVLLTGGFRSGVAMRGALSSDAVDAVGIARPLVLEPDLSRRLMAYDDARALPVSLATGISSLDSMLTGAWYQQQIHRMADGHEPTPNGGRFAAAWWYIKDQISSGSTRGLRGG